MVGVGDGRRTGWELVRSGCVGRGKVGGEGWRRRGGRRGGRGRPRRVRTVSQSFRNGVVMDRLLGYAYDSDGHGARGGRGVACTIGRDDDERGLRGCGVVGGLVCTEGVLNV